MGKDIICLILGRTRRRQYEERYQKVKQGKIKLERGETIIRVNNGAVEAYGNDEDLRN
ncbi:MAG: hypothetical protein H6754_05140 [Candidatus Omnitrophica bacterium]|nr:hypothetical protein [Candidatus Omnitrophota bacterium]